MTKDEALDLALEALEKYCTPYQDGTHPADEAIAAVKQARSVPVQEPVACGACNGSGWIVRDPDIGTDQKCFVCDGAGVPAAPVQEPLEYWNAVEGWVKIDEVRQHFDSVGCGTIYKNAGEGRVPLTVAQRQWVGLTDEEIVKVLGAVRESISGNVFLAFAQAIEAKLKEKNT